ncbi:MULTISPECIES: ABC transporter permease [Paenibacillus]|uniref:Glycine betaine/carnitine/choline transport system permease protein OpuCD n=1 Tax=Paenibacillus azoreducens TaxID=116718 RepID=A0A920CUL7_9BACL|nr:MULTISPECIES: ABC transporter permease [Paenibacillus]MBE9917967.1 ABC transporter permease [Paenibacillus donghaensis]GIO49572.1 glycine betaine/carnitine/choline transport system permease protein OpuCD [Paenibacillus azoreducens]
MQNESLTFMDFLSYVSRNSGMLWEYFIQHIVMVVIGLGLAVVVGVPLGILCSRSKWAAKIILFITNILQVVPSLAMLVILMLWLGLGTKTVMVGLFLYSLNPITRNTYVGLKQVSPSYLESGRGIGMSAFQLLVKVRFPLSLTYIMSGLRIAAVIAIGVVTIAPLVGGGGLGREIYAGLNSNNSLRIFAGAIPAALLAIVADVVLGYLQRKMDLAKRKSGTAPSPTNAQNIG